MAETDFIQIKDNGLILKLDKLTPELENALLSETKRQSDKLTNYIVKNHLTGGTSATRLAVRSGSLRRLTIPIKPIAYSQKMKGGTRFASSYARTHVGKKGQVTKIKPITSDYLAIPIGAALSAAGVPKYSSPRAVPDLTPIRSRKGNLILARVSKAAIEPFFLLLKEVEVPTRVHPEDILAKNIKRIATDYRKAISKTLGDTL